MDTAHKSYESIATPAWELVSLTCLVAFYIVVAEFGGETTLWLRLIAGPVVLAGILLAGAVRMILADAAAMWTALFWFRVSAAIYYGIGNLSPYVLPDEFRIYMETFFQFTDADVAQVNVLFAVSVLAVLLAAKGFITFISAIAGAARPSTSTRAMLAVGLLFLAIGAPIKYFLVLPTMLNIMDFVVPGAVGTFGNFTVPALFFITAYAFEHDRRYVPMAVLLVVLEGSIGLLAMTKQGVMTPLIVFLLALLRTRVTLPRLLAAGAIVVFMFVAIIPIVIDGRIELGNRYGTDFKAGFGERVEVLSRAVTGDLRTISSETSASGIALVRISYVNQASFAMHLYDSGQAGSTLENAYAAFIPRFLWPDKPIMTTIGSDFNMMARGSEASSSSPTLAGEAYWNFGWMGVLIVMGPAGILFAALSRYALDMLHSGRWIFFPAVILGMQIGHRVDGHVVADLFGAPVILIGTHMVLAVVERGLEMVLPASRPLDGALEPMSQSPRPARELRR